MSTKGVLVTYKLVHSFKYPCGTCGCAVCGLADAIHAQYRLKGYNRMPLFKLFCSKKCLRIFERTTDIALLTYLITHVEGIVYHPSVDMKEEIDALVRAFPEGAEGSASRPGEGVQPRPDDGQPSGP